MPHSPSAAEILTSVAARYAAARTYQDTGEQTTVFVHGPKSWQRRTMRKVFRSAMERPTRFLFEYKEVAVGPESEWHVGAMWRDDAGVHAWSYLHPTLRSNLAFGLELAGLTGVSGGLSSFVTKLFLPELECNPVLPDADEVTRIDRGMFDEHECHRIEAPPRRQGGESVVLWFDKASWLLRGREETSTFDESVRRRHDESIREALEKMARDDPNRPMMEEAVARRASSRTEDYTTVSTTIWRPRVDEPIDPRAFVFVPSE